MNLPSKAQLEKINSVWTGELHDALSPTLKRLIQHWSPEWAQALRADRSDSEVEDVANGVWQRLARLDSDDFDQAINTIKECEKSLVTAITQHSQIIARAFRSGHRLLRIGASPSQLIESRCEATAAVALLLRDLPSLDFDESTQTWHHGRMHDDSVTDDGSTPHDLSARFTLTTEEAAAIERAHLDPYSLKAGEWRVIKDAALRGEDVMCQIELKERFNEACHAFPELRQPNEVTAKQLTEFFKMKHAAARIDLKRTEGEVLPDSEKEKVVELVDAFRSLGGRVLFEKQQCSLQLNKTGSMQQHRFSVRTTTRPRRTLWSNLKLPKLTFEEF